ncbi:hypothetical protein [Lysinibacillus sp. BPa_S21]|uniref:hypothetical protein n=1 Tax=Lysinibacillus sp. BPa_S21 TaxID=2932478 RepID=UPI0020124FB0|nr:hypothetical protein [Lysinibacillus sp. BPa_S21]MCL1696364.1 hypothetical protein [Lysinibacillus sp. BPa_S21]
MQINKTREQLETEIKSLIQLFASTVNKKEVELIVEHLNSKHGIKKTTIYSLFNNSNNVGKLTVEELALFGQQLVIKLGIDQNEWMDTWFTEREKKEYESYQFVDIQSMDEIDFPMMRHNVVDLGDGYYLTSLTKQELGRLYKYGKLNYNPNVQRGMKKVLRYGLVSEEPIVIQKKVNEIRNLTLKNKLRPSTVILNAKQFSSEEDSELVFDKDKNTLTITEGTILDIVDGMHRTLGTYSAYIRDKEIQGSFPIIISNKSDEEIKRYQLDLNKHTPLTKGRANELKEENYASEVINILKSKGELKDRITTSTDIKHSLKGNEFIPYNTLYNAISSVFKINSRLDARKIAEEINEYLVYLFGIFGKHENDEYKVLFDADIFEGHLALMKKMDEKEMRYDELEKIIDINEFHINNDRWNEYKLLNKNIGKLSKKDRSSIVKYFESLV